MQDIHHMHLKHATQWQHRFAYGPSSLPLSADIPASQKGVYLFYNPPINFHMSQHAWLTVLPAPCFQVRLEIGISLFPQSMLKLHENDYFVVSKHNVLILYFMKWLGLRLRGTKPVSVFVTFFTFKDVDSIFCWLFCTFQSSICDQLLNFTTTALYKVCFSSM